MKIPSASKLGVWRSLAVFLLCYFLPWVPFISCQNPSFTVLILQLFIIKIENGGNHPRMDRMQLGMWHAAHDCAPSPFSELYPFLFFFTSSAPMCMGVSVCVCACSLLMHWCPSQYCCYLELINDGQLHLALPQSLSAPGYSLCCVLM